MVLVRNGFFQFALSVLSYDNVRRHHNLTR